MPEPIEYIDLSELQNEADRAHMNEILPKIESWVTIDNKSFFFSFRCIDTIPSGLYSMTYNDGQGFGVTKMDYKSEEFFHLPSLPHKQILADLQKFWDNKQKFIDYNLNPKRGIILHGDPGCHSRGTGILMYDGSIKNVEDVVVGDKLMGPDSEPRLVLKLVRGREEMVKIRPNKGTPFVVNKNHILHLTPSGKNTSFRCPLDLSVDNYINNISKVMQDRLKLTRASVNFMNNNALPIDPYILGVWLGDGTSSKTQITTIDSEIEEIWRNYATSRGLIVGEFLSQKNSRVKQLTIKSESESIGANNLLNDFKSLNLINNKHIPQIYKTASREDRLKLLAGLIDTDGYTQGNIATTTNTGMQYMTKLKTLADDVVYLCLSLGYYASCSKVNKSCYVNKKKVFDGEYYSISISGELSDIPVNLIRKKAKIRKMNKDVKRTGFSYELLPEDDYYGFTLDGDHLYLTSDFLIHHNCGKTSLIYLLVDEIKKRNGISVYFDVPDNWIEIAKLIRKVEKERPILCIIEDIDLIIARHGEESFLNFLDGLNSITNVVYVATTNNLSSIPDRIKDRPSRFDKQYEIKKPTDQDRKIYFETKLLEEDKKKYDLKKLVKDTRNFTMAHIKEVFISLYILGNDYNEVIGRLKKSKITDSSIGFNLDEYEE